jgi:hypothetical protein
MIGMTQTKLIYVITVLAFILVMVVGGVSPAHSFYFRNYERFKDTEGFKLYLHGVGHGYSGANADLFVRGLPLLYCQPDKLALGPENYADILQEEIRRNRLIEPNTLVAILLLSGLQNTFPCK